jgi:prolipoprotein diacylglyceryltransferase
VQILSAHPVIAQWHSFTLYAHGFFFAVAAVVAVLLLELLAKSYQLSVENLTQKGLLIFLAGLVGARLGFFISYPSQFQSWSQVFFIWEGGLVSYFGIAAGLLTAMWLFKTDRVKWLDCIALATLAGWAIGRLGNYYAADSVGVHSAVWHIFYGRIPIQLFESLWCVALGVYLYSKRSHLASGKIFIHAWVGYFAGRFVIDFWRDEGVLAGLHLSQWTSLTILAISLLYFHYYAPKK